jgi:predicted TIM-barrel fold metal-dependent hydrolase
LEIGDVEYGILTAAETLSLSAIPNGALASAIAAAHNRRLVEEWLPTDARLRGSLLVAPQDAERAAAEIRRLGGHPDIAQVLVSFGAQAGYGDLRYRPIWEACADVGVPLALRAGAEGIGLNAAPTATGYPSTELEIETLLPTAAMSHLVSIVARGILQRLPEVGVVILGAGAGWLPALLDRLDATWRSLGSEVSLEEPPSETVRRRVRVAVGLEEAPSAGAELNQMLILGGAGRSARGWSEEVVSENARTFYGLQAVE